MNSAPNGQHFAGNASRVLTSRRGIKYVIDDGILIGQGAVGKVFFACELESRTPVAIKVRLLLLLADK